ncbi:MAG: RNA polymerase sigma factor RpoH [Defluviicoccus sp.]|jgi:RNA polymerase sigma-32 factor|nr:RNA polymerase sigma factor RpoH [Defluviicoccus sp.]MDG4593024.1 RNA polymerase sigma factor RpoH [Defluviicoccus sp.]
MRALRVPSLDSDRGLTRYFREIWSYPVLSPEEEFMLAVRFHEHGDTEAAHRLVTSHLRLVAKIAAGYRGYGLPMADLIAEGNIGLMKAVKKFEPQRGFRLATYAMWWIRAAITEFVLRSWSMVKLGTLAAQKKLFFSLNRIKRELNLISDAGLDHEQAETVATTLNVSAQDVIDMERRLASPDVSLNAPRSRDDDDGAEFMDTLVDDAADPEVQAAGRQESTQRHALLTRALEALPERERHILAERQLADEPKTLEELGLHYGISRERVRQLEARALERVTKAVRAMAAEGASVAVPA